MKNRADRLSWCKYIKSSEKSMPHMIEECNEASGSESDESRERSLFSQDYIFDKKKK